MFESSKAICYAVFATINQGAFEINKIMQRSTKEKDWTNLETDKLKKDTHAIMFLSGDDIFIQDGEQLPDFIIADDFLISHQNKNGFHKILALRKELVPTQEHLPDLKWMDVHLIEEEEAIDDLEEHLITIKTDSHISSNEIHQQNRTDFQYFMKSKKLELPLLLSIFAVLLLLFFLKSNLDQKNKQLQARLNSRKQIIQTEENKTALSQKQQITAQQLGLDQYSNLSYYVDEIAYSLVEQEKLSEINIHPWSENEEKYDRSKIIVKGLSSSFQNFNNWMNSIRELEWISKIENVEYQQKEDEYAFKLDILINE